MYFEKKEFKLCKFFKIVEFSKSRGFQNHGVFKITGFSKLRGFFHLFRDTQKIKKYEEQHHKSANMTNIAQRLPSGGGYYVTPTED